MVPLEVTIRANEHRVIDAGVDLANWRVYSISVAFRLGFVAMLPGTTAIGITALRLLPFAVQVVPARGRQLAVYNLARDVNNLPVPVELVLELLL